MRTESHPFTKSNNCLTCHQIHSEKAKCTEWRDLCMPVWTKRCYLNNSGTNISTVENIKESLRFLRRYFFPVRSSDPLLMAHEDCLIVAIVV